MASKDPLQDFLFDSVKEGQVLLRQSAVKKLHLQLLKRLETYYNEKTGIMELSVATESQDLSYELCHQLYAQLSSFYVDKAVQKQKETYEKIKFKVDSLRALIQSRDYALAGFRTVTEIRGPAPTPCPRHRLTEMFACST
ncbi:MAG: hypothetical protein U0T81_13620 [Saprospiraceae bacterium]